MCGGMWAVAVCAVWPVAGRRARLRPSDANRALEMERSSCTRSVVSLTRCSRAVSQPVGVGGEWACALALELWRLPAVGCGSVRVRAVRGLALALGLRVLLASSSGCDV